MLKSVIFPKIGRIRMTVIEDIGYIGVKILLYLKTKKDIMKKNEANISELIQTLKIGRQTIYIRLKFMEKLYNFITIERRGLEKIVSLTEKGEKVAEHLVEIEKISAPENLEKIKRALKVGESF